MKKSILILSCGTNAGWHMVKTLRGSFDGYFRIIGVDTNEAMLVPCAGMLDSFYTVPPSKSVDFVETIEEILKNEHPDYILPSFDFDQNLFYPESDILRRYSVNSLSTPVETLSMYGNKTRMHNALSLRGLPVPKLYSEGDIIDKELYFVKPIHGVGSVGAAIMIGADIRRLNSLDNIIIQEVCSLPEITMECFTYQGRFSSVCRERLQTKSGVCTKARVFKSPRLEAIGKRFAEMFKTPMFFNLQFMKSKSEGFVITDVNLRLAGGMGLSCAAGWNEASAIAKVLLGRSINDVMETLPEFIPEQYVVRVYDELPTKVLIKTVAFDLDGTLLDSRERHGRVLRAVLKSFNLNVDTSGLVEYKRSGKNNIDFLISNGLNKTTANNIQLDWIRLIESNEFLNCDVLYHDAKELLHKYDGWRRILVTARRNIEGLMQTLDRVGIKELFDIVRVVEPGELASAEKAKILKDEKAIVFYGDTQSDYVAARDADVRFIYRSEGFHDYATVFHVSNKGA